jgi:tetratricopeptide (TPR) repeat protein
VVPLPPLDETPPGHDLPAEVISPVKGFLRIEDGGQAERPVPVMIALTSEAIWIQGTWRLRSAGLQNLDIDRWRSDRVLALALGPEPSTEKLILTFASAAEGARWYGEFRRRREQLAPDALPGDRHTPEGVALVRRAPEVPHDVVGRVEFTGATQWAADRGLQLRAAMRGGDAVIQLDRQRCPEIGWGARHCSGVAVRALDADARKRFRLRWYAEEVGALVNRVLLLLVIQAALLLLGAVVFPGLSGLEQPTGETRSEALASAGLATALLYAWPLVLLAVLWVLRWPQLLRIVGLAALAATTGRGLTAWLAHLLAVQTTGATLAEGKLWMLLDPVDWAFMIIGVSLCLRAWRLAGDARQILPLEAQVVPTARKAWSRGLLGVTGVYALGVLGLVATVRYEASTHVLQPGFDPRREQEALVALNEGSAQANKGELASAERSFQRALQLWEELAARPRAPSLYRANLALTLYDLGWTRERQGRRDEAEGYYSRAVTLADELAGGPQVDEQFKQTMASARQALAELRRDKSFKLLDEKDRTATRKCEEADVKLQKGEPEAERLYQEALALWEEVLPQAANEEYKKSTPARLAGVYLSLGELQQRLGKRSAAEASLKKAIEYGEKAVAREPDRPLPRHNLDVARQTLDRVRDQALEDEVTKLWKAERFADAVDLCLRSIDEPEEQVRLGRDRDAAVRRLAYRLNRLAWFLAHSPDGGVRDTRAAVKHARRATDLRPDMGDHWYTLATVQYRNGDWRDSLASLEKLKAREGALDASGWFVSAMNLHQLKRGDEAKDALRKGVEWIEERQRQAEANALLRFQFEIARPAIEALQREAENLIQGKDPANRGVA